VFGFTQLKFSPEWRTTTVTESLEERTVEQDDEDGGGQVRICDCRKGMVQSAWVMTRQGSGRDQRGGLRRGGE
jgi:hypothetical protein